VDDLVNPCEQKMRLEVMALGELGTLRRFEFLHGGAIAPRLLGTERVDRIDVAVAVILIDLCGRQLLAHGYNSIPRSCRRRRATDQPAWPDQFLTGCVSRPTDVSRTS